MKIVFTGGGTGGHFYPIIAVANAITKELQNSKYVKIELFYMSDEPYNQALLDRYNIKFIPLRSGKMRLYFSFKNISDIFKTVFAIIKATKIIYKIFPDVIFSKGGYASLPVVIAARFFNIPVILHESDSVPGKSNKFAGKFAEKVALSYTEASEFFPAVDTAVTGQPIRDDILHPIVEGSYEKFGLDPKIKTIFVLGGSQGSEFINNAILRIIPKLIVKYQVIHQVGKMNIESFTAVMEVALQDSKYKGRYKAYSYLDSEKMRMAAGISDLIVSRAGSTIFEIASWEKPSILIPITKSNADHQRKNAYLYSRAGACQVIEEENMTTNLFVLELDKLLSDEARLARMVKATEKFRSENAAGKIAKQIMIVLKNHGK